MATILIVEDDQELLKMLQVGLKRMGHDIIGSPNGVDALYQAAYAKPDLVVLDLMMPWASGDAVLGFIRSTDALKGTRVLVLSAHPNGQQISEQLNADAYLAKPVDINTLRQNIESLLAVPRGV
jgi:two-component system KDP operon response regulator KdpE